MNLEGMSSTIELNVTLTSTLTITASTHGTRTFRLGITYVYDIAALQTIFNMPSPNVDFSCSN